MFIQELPPGFEILLHQLFNLCPPPVLSLSSIHIIKRILSDQLRCHPIIRSRILCASPNYTCQSAVTSPVLCSVHPPPTGASRSPVLHARHSPTATHQPAILHSQSPSPHAASDPTARLAYCFRSNPRGHGGARGGSHPTQVQVVTSSDSTPLGRTLGPARTRTRAAVKTTRGGRSLARRAREFTTPTTPHTQTHTLLSAHKLSSYHRPVSSPT